MVYVLDGLGWSGPDKDKKHSLIGPRSLVLVLFGDENHENPSLSSFLDNVK